MPSPVIFISYSHDSAAHRERVLELAERLRADGLDARLDQYVKGTPSEGWPRWMLNLLDEASFVLVVCSEAYYHRFRGNEAPGRGRGADWEAALITQQIYDSKSRTFKFVPVMFAVGEEQFIPEPLRQHTHYVLAEDEGYQALCAFLRGTAGVDASPIGPFTPPPRTLVQALTPDGTHETERHESPDLESHLKAAELALQSKDYAGAWAASREALDMFPRSEAAQRTQSMVAMAWLEDVVVPESKTFSDIVNPLLAFLTRRAGSLTGSDGADVLAHIGWGYFLKSRDSGEEFEVEQLYRRALTLDADNPFAHSMWGHWILWNHGELSEAKEHFVAALKPDRARAFTRTLQLASLQGRHGDAECIAELISALNDMRKNGEFLALDDRRRLLTELYYMYRDVVEERLDSILFPGEHLQTFIWLNEKGDDGKAFIRAYWLARLTEAKGDHAEALALYKSALAKPSSAYEKMIRDGIERCTRVLPTPPAP